MYHVVLFLLIINIVLMAAPYYNLLVVSERGKFGRAHVQVDVYFKRIIKGILFRCYFIQWTTLILRLLPIVPRGEWSFMLVLTNWRLLIKAIAWMVIMVVYNIAYLGVQPRIDALFGRVGGESIPQEAGAQHLPHLTRRKQGAVVCFFLVLVAVIWRAQVYSSLSLALTIVLLALALLFSWRPYKAGVQYGWV